MSLFTSLKRLVGLEARGDIRVHVFLKGRTGAGWYDVDQWLPLAAGATLTSLLDECDRRGLRLRELIGASPHLGQTLMINGERCPLEENLDRPLANGDEVFLLAPLAGG